MLGGAGGDIFVFMTGEDASDKVIAGGDGQDFIDFSFSSTSAYLLLDSSMQVEGIFGSSPTDFFDASGLSTPAVMSGMGARDVLIGGSNYDMLQGGDGDDIAIRQ